MSPIAVVAITIGGMLVSLEILLLVLFFVGGRPAVKAVSTALVDLIDAVARLVSMGVRRKAHGEPVTGTPSARSEPSDA